MKNKYNELILSQIEDKFNRVILFIGIIAFCNAFVELHLSKTTVFFYIDLLGAVLHFLGFLLRNKIKFEIKVSISISYGTILGFLSLFSVGVTGTGFIVLGASTVAAVAFLSTKLSRIYSIIVIANILILILLIKQDIILYSNSNIQDSNNPLIWVLQIGVFSLLIILLQATYKAIKHLLIKKILELENNVKETINIAYYDSLTGLPNRNKFMKDISTSSGEQKKEGYLVLFDLKNFKLLNSIYGSDTGDKILTKITLIFNELKGEEEMIYRISGSEFAWWMKGINYNIMLYRLGYYEKQFLSRLKELGVTKKIEFDLSYAHYPDDGDSLETVYRNASMAIEFAKQKNVINVVGYNKKLEQNILLEEKIKQLLVRAVESDEFLMAYQEKVNGVTGEVYGVEALARWNTEEEGWISPRVFIPILENSKMLISFGRLSVKKVLDDYKLLQKHYSRTLKISINISPTLLVHKGFIEFLMKEVSRRNYDPGNIIVEITEEVLIEGLEETAAIVEKLRQFGIGVSLDDFGTGYSSLNYLSELDFEEVKIDKSFIDRLEKDSKIIPILKSIISISNAFNIELVAEGVEFKDQYDLLMELGCFNIQGYYFSKPLLLEDIIKTKTNPVKEVRFEKAEVYDRT